MNPESLKQETNPQVENVDRVPLKVKVRKIGQVAYNEAKNAIRHTNELRSTTLSTIHIPVRVRTPELDTKSSEILSEEEELEQVLSEIANIDAELGRESSETLSEEEELAQILSEIDGLNTELGEKSSEILSEEEELEQVLSEIANINAELSGEEAESLPEEDELKQVLAEIADIDRELYGEPRPLVAINADFSHDKATLARDIAERTINAEVSNEKGFKRFLQSIWKGNIAKKYYQAKYEREFKEGKRIVDVDGGALTLDDIIERRKDSTIERFILGATEEYGKEYIHEKAGEELKVDEKTTELVKPIIEEYAKEWLEKGVDLKTLKNDKDARRLFNNKIKELIAKSRDNGEPINDLLVNNYFEVAIQASEMAHHRYGIDRVMEGFKVYNAKARESVRTEAHRNNIDKIIDRLDSKVGHFIPAEITAAAIGSLSAFGRFGASTAARIIVPVGGIAISSALAGVRERNRITDDRTRMMRDLAMGLEYRPTEIDESLSRRDRRRAEKRAKYEADIHGTLYELKSAKSLTDSITKAIEGDSSEDILRAIAEARVRIDFSDAKQKDLIAYSSSDHIGDERLALDIAVIRAEQSLSDEDKEKLKAIKGVIGKQIIDGGYKETGERITGVEEIDKNFNRMRAVMAMKKAGKTAAIGTAFFFASQEIIATLSPDKISLLEKAGIIKHENNEGADETILASLRGPRTSSTHEIANVSADDQNSIGNLERHGYRIDESKTIEGHTTLEQRSEVIDVSPSESTNQMKIFIDDYANNGTRAADGNELRAYIENGQMVSGMYGNSTLPNGQVLNYDELLANGQIKACVNVGGADFEIVGKLNEAGQMTWMENGLATTSTGETMQLIGENGERFYNSFMIFADNGVDSEGVQHAIALATDPAGGTFSGTVEQVVNYDIPIDHPAVYTFVKETQSGLFTGGIVAPVVTSRTGLGTPIIAGEEVSSQPLATSESETNPSPTAEASSREPNTPSSREFESFESTPERTDFVDLITREFSNLVGEEGIDIMTSGDELSINSPRIRNLWDSLSDEAKDAVINFESTERPYGKALRDWLIANGHIPLI